MCRSDHAINFINTFGRKGGFEKISEIIDAIMHNDFGKMGSLSVKDALPLMSTYCECLGKIAPLLHKTFAHKFIPQFIERIKATLLNSNPDQLRDTKREFIEELLNHMHKGLLFRLGGHD